MHFPLTGHEILRLQQLPITHPLSPYQAADSLYRNERAFDRYSRDPYRNLQYNPLPPLNNLLKPDPKPAYDPPTSPTYPWGTLNRNYP